MIEKLDQRGRRTQQHHQPISCNQYWAIIPPNNSRIETTFKCSWNIYQDRTYVLGYNTNLNKFKWIETIQSVFSDYSGINLEINNRERKNSWYLENKQQTSKITHGSKWNSQGTLKKIQWTERKLKCGMLKFLRCC